MNLTFQHKKIILIGGSGVIGKTILKHLVLEGLDIGVTYNKTYINKSVSELVGLERQYFIEQMDVTCPESIKKGLRNLITRLGGVDAFIYNAGVCEDALLGMMRIDNWNKVMDVNVNGAFLTSRIISNHMLRQNKGKILFISSYKGITGAYGQSNYSASKAALIGFAKSIARDLGQFGVTVNVVCPGFMVTNLNRNAPYKEKNARDSSILSRISNPDELANFITFLISDQVSNVSGQVFNVDSRI